ncbi:MAG: aldehyde dehydrogenase family protein [Planctomycetota bacterium]
MDPFLLAGARETADATIPVLDKHRGTPLAEVARADAGHFDRALRAADGARSAMASLRPDERAGVLEQARSRLGERRDALVELLVAEGGKPVRAARVEVDRTLTTFAVSAREALAAADEPVSLGDASGQARGYAARVRRVPIGVAGFITPFNFPLNLVAHKVAPAVAAGCPFVLKPASSTPLSALAIGEALLDAGLPEGAFSVLPARGPVAEVLGTDDRVRKLSFTGSDAVGWRLAQLAWRKRVTLELGGNAAVVVDGTADLDDAAARITNAAFGQAGQSCISVQRIVATADVADALRERLVERAREVRAGDPRDEETLVGPMINEREAERVLAWVDEAVAGGATVLAGGERDGAVVQATLLEGAAPGSRVLDDEVFGPVATLVRVPDFEAALREVNRSRYGLQAGVFTADRSRAARAFDVLEVGGVVIGDVPTWRAEAMPYGGVKDSGVGREGPRYAIEALTEPRLLVERT